MTCAAPIARSRSSFSSEEEVAITVAPIARAICSAKIDTPPVPSINMLSPTLRPPLTTRARQAVTPAVVRVAAAAWVQPAGACVKDVAGATTTSRAKPSIPSPGVVAKSARVASPSSQVGKKVDTTWSPGLNSVTSDPTASTTPAPSAIGMRPSAAGNRPVTTPRSWKFSEVAYTRTRMASGPGSPGSGRSTNARPSSPCCG